MEQRVLSVKARLIFNLGVCLTSVRVQLTKRGNHGARTRRDYLNSEIWKERGTRILRAKASDLRTFKIYRISSRWKWCSSCCSERCQTNQPPNKHTRSVQYRKVFSTILEKRDCFSLNSIFENGLPPVARSTWPTRWAILRRVDLQSTQDSNGEPGEEIFCLQRPECFDHTLYTRLLSV